MKRFKNLVYLAENDVPQEAAMARAVSLATNNQARLSVIDVVRELPAAPEAPRGVPDATELTSARIEARRAELEALVAPHRDQVEIQVDVLVGRKYLEAIRRVLGAGHDLLVKPAEDPGWADRLLGSEDMHLLRKCPCPVWLLKPDEKPDYGCILAAVDLEPDVEDPEEQALNRLILELASSLALSDFAQLHVIHVWDAPEAAFFASWSDDPDATEARFTEGKGARHGAALRGLLEGLRGHVGEEAYAYLAPQIHMPRGLAKKEIPALAERLGADLMVMGTVARAGIAGLIMGNTAESILHDVHCSILAVKPPGFVSPVPAD
jgi:nucleotide-binding universal stress UspA family protein